MIELYTFAGIGASLLLLLFLIGAKQEAIEKTAQEIESDAYRRRSQGAKAASAAARRIFSAEDRAYIGTLENEELRRLYEEERRQLALHWVRHTSEEVGAVMRQHRLLARTSENLDVRHEALLLLRHMELRFLCGLLTSLIFVFGPHALGDLAAFAGDVSQSIGASLQEPAPARRIA
jgi:hypothetical protein